MGFPEQATIVFHELIDSDLPDWPAFIENVVDANDHRSAEGGVGEGVNGRNPDEDRDGRAAPTRGTTGAVRATAVSERDSAWVRLSEALHRLADSQEMPAGLAAYRTWAVQVSRYSFHTGQLAAAIAEDDNT